jgi:tetratricopeptide (TPR) repeat protein
VMNPGEGAPFDEMLRALDKALAAHPRNERAHYGKGMVLKRLNRTDEATKHFRTAAEINPRNVDAVREVRLAEMRKDSKPPAGAVQKKLLSKLFGSSKND